MIVHNVAAVIAGAATCLVAVLDRYEFLLVYVAVFGVFVGQLPVTYLLLLLLLPTHSYSHQSVYFTICMKYG